MKLSNSKIERTVVNQINVLANEANSYLISNIQVGDKAISFDGDITVLSDDSEKKESYLGVVPVQLKGTRVETFSTGKRKFTFTKADLMNFYKREGVLLLLGEVMSSGEIKIYYKSLLTVELSQILKQLNNKNKSSLRIEFRSIDNTNLYTVCNKFLYEQKLQPRILVEQQPGINFSYSSYMFTSSTFNPENDNLFEHDFTVYGAHNNVNFPLVVGRFGSITRKGKLEFITNGESFLLDAAIETNDKQIIITLEEIILLTLDNGNSTFNYKFLGFHSLEAQLKTLPFLKHLFSGHEIICENLQFSIAKHEKDALQAKELVASRCSFINELQLIFQNLKVNIATVFDINKEENIAVELNTLYKIFKLHQYDGVKLTNPNLTTALVNFSVADKLILLYVRNSENKLITNLFSEDVQNYPVTLTNNELQQSVAHSLYSLLTVDALAFGVNIDYSIIRNSFDKIEPFIDDLAFHHTNQFCLNCIRAYDISQKIELLDVANYIYRKFNEATNTNPSDAQVIFINQTQIEKRKEGALLQETISQLYKYKQLAIKNDLYQLLFGINTLLENSFEASHCWGIMTRIEQEELKSYPIFTLYQNLAHET